MDLRNARCFQQSHPDVYNKAKAVAQMTKVTPAGNGYVSLGYCTGWLVGPNGYLLTNNHCVASQADVDKVTFKFNYESPNGDCSTGGIKDTDIAQTHEVEEGGEFIMTNKELDFTLIKLTGNQSTQFGYVDLSTTKATIDAKIFIPQHPSGRDKSIGIFDSNASDKACHVEKYYSDSFAYTCDTEGGSSGSPVIDLATMKAIGLHYAGQGSCNGNVAKFIDQIYPLVCQYVYGSCDGGATTGCQDDTNWRDTDGWSCTDYKTQGICDDYGDWAVNGVSANDACCDCK
mmetsp:Transcript_32109/g.78019  ORF Transcript_32109/g.78019 Transcript_32109/m.78019 type:complete len:287 (+) Transcript_32109:1036-1896(+)